MNNNPDLKLVAQLGDSNPFDHGGQFVFIDKTGINSPFLEVLEISSGNTETEYDKDGNVLIYGNMEWEINHIGLDQCIYVDGFLYVKLSDDEDDLPDHPIWFSDKIEIVAEFVGLKPIELIKKFCSENVVERAVAYKSVADCYGIINFDSHPHYVQERRDLEKRYCSHIESLKSN